MEKSKLAKLALTALTVAATMPAVTDAKDSGTFLAASCGGNGKCGGGRSSSCGGQRAAAGCGAKSSVTYNAPDASDPYSARQNTYQAADTYNSAQQSTWGTQQQNPGAWSSQQNTSSWGQSNAQPSYADSYRSTYSSDTTTMRPGTVNESEFKRQLDPDTRAMFENMSTAQKARAIQLSQSTYANDKNAAVREAQKAQPSGSYNSSMRSSGWGSQSTDYNR